MSLQSFTSGGQCRAWLPDAIVPVLEAAHRVIVRSLRARIAKPTMGGIVQELNMIGAAVEGEIYRRCVVSDESRPELFDEDKTWRQDMKCGHLGWILTLVGAQTSEHPSLRPPQCSASGWIWGAYVKGELPSTPSWLS